MRPRARRKGAGTADGAGHPEARRAAGPGSRGRRAHGCHLPCARAAFAEGRLRMIARLTGTPVARTLDGIVLDVSGVGYLLRLTARAQRKAKEGREIAFDTYLHVRDDALQLYGFAEPSERELFEQLLAVSGVGPKVALAILSGSTPDDLRRAIANEDTTRFMA